MNWVRRWFGRRRPDFGVPPPPDPIRMGEAVAEAQRAKVVLDRVRRDDQRVNETAERADRLRRQNHLGPSFWAWAESLGEGKQQ